MENNTESQPISKKLLAVNALLLCAMIYLVFLIYGTLHMPKKESPEPITVNSPIFQNVDLQAKAVYVFDVAKNEVVFKKNEFAQMPLASLTKLMMGLTATTLIGRDTHITIKKEFLEEEGDSGLLADESWRLKDLLDFSLVVSSNDGARSIASVAGAFDLKTNDYNLGRKDFIDKMNSLAQSLGLKQTYFINESGLDQGGTSGGYGSAIDVEKLMQYILKNQPEILEATKYTTTTLESFNKTHIAKNTNISANRIPGLIASKTGYTDLAGGNLAIAFDASIGRPIIAVVLGSTQEGRFEDIQKLVDASLEYVRE